MADPGVVSACIARLDALRLTADGAGALEDLARAMRDERRQAGDLDAIIAAVELVAALSTPPGEPPTPAGKFFSRAAGLLRSPSEPRSL